MPTRPTIADLAREARVSVSTIDRILSGRGKVKPATVEHVLATAERVGFHAVGTIRSRQGSEAPQRSFGFLLNDRSRMFYDQLGRTIAREVAGLGSVQGRAVISHLADPDPDITAEALLELGSRCDAVAAVCIDHPRVNLAVEQLAARGVPVLAMLSDISSAARRGFVGANDWQLGRTAGWFVRRLCPQGGEVAIVTGDPRYLCQQANAASFRTYISGTGGAELRIVEAPSTGESDARAAQIVRDLASRHPRLAAVMIAGGGLEGAAEGLRGHASPPLLMGTELTPRTRAALVDGRIDMILSHPSETIARSAVRALLQLVDGSAPRSPLQKSLPFEVLVAENC
ncbi:LacI family DNA-binding transcriptional regulator [Mangrovicoccus sp. HB161399]|uniref:LacI family DNA-binding transcriptional regulator n=1 Tax=Mangrovicoccus sp. HB161399 TaxID=2720392 RepID=UPI0015580825|nr:LacI family DNA-binding transcriptional regulator [Mangrovicoccus sp. HB161399]